MSRDEAKALSILCVLAIGSAASVALAIAAAVSLGICIFTALIYLSVLVIHAFGLAGSLGFVWSLKAGTLLYLLKWIWNLVTR